VDGAGGLSRPRVTRVLAVGRRLGRRKVSTRTSTKDAEDVRTRS
jgi:hypothetical protein